MRKLDGVIGDRLKTLQTADPQEAQRLESEVKYLYEQLKQHRRTFERMDESTGVGYVAAKGKYTDEQIQKITSNLKIGDEVKRPDSRGRITKIENGNVTMELTMTRGRGKGQTMTVTTPISQYGNGWELTKPPRKRRNSQPVGNQVAETKAKRSRTQRQNTSVANRSSTRNVLNEHNVSPQQTREIINRITDNLLKDKDVEIAASQFNQDGKGTKDNPNKISGGIGIAGIVRHYGDTKQNLPEGESRTRHYQFGKQKHTRVSEDVKNHPNAFVRGGGRYEPEVRETFESIKKSTGLSDSRIARALNTLVREGDFLPGMFNHKQEAQLTKVTYLIFGRESVRNKRNLVQASILFSQVEKGRISLEDAVAKLPMSPDGAQSSVKRLDDFDSGTRPYPKEGTQIHERITEVQQKETDVINDFIIDEMRRDNIETFENQQELIGYTERKIKEQLYRTYGISLDSDK